jgi:hypothetical protein
MTNSVSGAVSGIPAIQDDMFISIHASGTALEINPGDYVSFSANYGHATHDGVAWFKASGIGIALDRNPAYDNAGRKVVNSALLVQTRGIFHASANFSGQPLYGVLAYPDMTGSGVNAGSGVTGLGAVWNTGAPVSVSGGTGAAPVKGVAQVIGWSDPGSNQTGELDIRLWPRNADYY